MPTTPLTSVSPAKTAGSPARVRHNPYARSTASPGTPMDTGFANSSMTESFADASIPPLTPPTAAAPANVSWSSQQHELRVEANEFVPPGATEMAAENSFGTFSPQTSYYSDVPAAYDSVDPSVAVAMYSAASAAAANAAAARGMNDFNGSGPSTGHGRSRRGPQQQEQPATPAMANGAVPRLEDIEALAGTLAEHARSASGSSFIQSAIKESPDPRCLPFVWNELAPSLGDLLLDAHGCYVIKSLLERLPREEITYILQSISGDEQLGFSVCTHSLHTRRVVQHIIEHLDGAFLCELMARHCSDIAVTQQGCIVMQRSMDHAPQGAARDALFDAIAINLVNFAKDPFANYVVQHLMEVGERVETAGAMWKAFRGRVVELACNKFASNVIEKCLFHCTAEVQHEMLTEMYSVGPQMLFNMLQDSFGNYIIQSSIALATFRDIGMIDECLRPVLAHTPYGHKIEARLDRRLKGKPVTARGPAPGTSQPAGGRGRKGRGSAADRAVPAGEEAW